MNISYKWITVFTIWVSATIIMAAPLSLFNCSLVTKAVACALIIIWWSIYFKWFRTAGVVDRTILVIKFLLRSSTGQTTIAKYNVPPEFLQAIVPVRQVHSGGIVEFTGKQYGQLFRLDPPRISEDDLASHIMRIEHVVNSLHGELMIKTIVCSRSNASQGLQDDLVRATDGKTDAQKEHLYQLYHEVAGNTVDVIDWQFYLFVGIGQHESVEHAQITLQSQLPGLLKYFNRAGNHCVPIRDVGEVALVYRQLFVQNKIMG